MPNTTHVEIAKYWLGKYICNDGSISDSTGDDRVMVICDLGEPSCWGCDRHTVSPEELRDDKGIDDIWRSKYIKKHLERCHIIAQSLGGEDKPSNLFLLCPRCHKESPNTTNAKAFFRWVYRKRHAYANGVPNMSGMYRLINEELSSRGMPDFETLIKVLSEDELKDFENAFSVVIDTDSGKIKTNSDMMKWLRHNTTIHFGERINRESIIIAIVDYIVQQYKKALSQSDFF